MTAAGLFAIDVAAELETLCGSQLQGPWQVPAELVRLAIARGSVGISARRVGGAVLLDCDGVLATRNELAELAVALDPGAASDRRQEAIAYLEERGATALLWAAGVPGAGLVVTCRSTAEAWGLEVRRGRARATVGDPAAGMRTGSRLRWRCGRRTARAAVAWLETALRFLPVPATVGGRPVAGGFPDGLYRMGVAEPLPAELAVTAGGDMPVLWLLRHGVLSTTAVVPGFPAFSAAVEMDGAVAPGASPAELRSAVNPVLPRIIDQAVRMLVLLADRLPTADEAVRRRITTLLLRAAALGLQRDRVLALELVPLREGGERIVVTPLEVAALAARAGGVLPAAEPGRPSVARGGGPVVELSLEERRLLGELLGLRFEGRVGSGPGAEPLRRLLEAGRRGWSRLRAVVGGRPLDARALTADERGAVGVAAAAGVELDFAAGGGSLRRRGDRLVLGRDAPGVRSAVAAVAADPSWLYPALLTVGVDPDEIPQELRTRWLESQEAPASAPFRGGGGTVG